MAGMNIHSDSALHTRTCQDNLRKKLCTRRKDEPLCMESRGLSRNEMHSRIRRVRPKTPGVQREFPKERLKYFKFLESATRIRVDAGATTTAGP